MQREFGGYLPLELPHGQELYTGAGVLRLNCGRNAIVAALRDAGAKKVYLPYYNCNTVYDDVTRAGFAVEHYSFSVVQMVEDRRDQLLLSAPRWATASGCCMSTTSALRRTTCWPRSSAAGRG